ncbi:ribosome biogenesis protein NOP53 [Harmonia axyridis]|uniref:ribosome biogenesis protein NOP53 n=1 Tax=Harmonia axyridis TaxID=115357 RepID=UPI001E274DE8|nr:ribosome biogenesis protein NOP53 [Harmonia axyridis]
MKKKRVSKRNKIAWRKHVNIEDVEEFLENQRFEEKFGLQVLNDESFTKDTGDTTDFLSKKERIKLKLANPRCFRILKPHTNVPDPLVKRNRVRTKEERTNKLLKLKEEQRKAKGILKAKEIDSIRGKQLYEKCKLERPKRGEFSKDVWEVSEVKSLGDWIRDDATVHNLRQTGAYLFKVTPTVQKKTSVLPTIEPPHPGTSYNPSFEDHQDLLREIGEKEGELIKRDKHLNRVTKSILKKVPSAVNNKSWFDEMSQGLPIANNQKIEEEDDPVSDSEYRAINPAVKNKKKTRKQRNTQKRLLIEERLRKLAKLEKKKIVELNSLKALEKYVKKREKEISESKVKREEYSKLKEKLPKRLGFHKFEENDLEFNMPSEITGNLRSVRKQSNLLVDRFINLQKRNLVAPSVTVQAKRAKIKRFIKPGHKDNWKKDVAGLTL